MTAQSDSEMSRSESATDLIQQLTAEREALLWATDGKATGIKIAWPTYHRIIAVLSEISSLQLKDKECSK